MRSWFAEWKHQRSGNLLLQYLKNEAIFFFFFLALVASLLYSLHYCRSWGDSLSLGSPSSSDDYRALPNIWAWCQSLRLLSNFTSSPSSNLLLTRSPCYKGGESESLTWEWEKGSKRKLRAKQVFSKQLQVDVKQLRNLHLNLLLHASVFKMLIARYAALNDKTKGYFDTNITTNVVIIVFLSHWKLFCDTIFGPILSSVTQVNRIDAMLIDHKIGVLLLLPSSGEWL